MKYSLIILLLISFGASAQKSCVQKLREARSAYEDGNIHIIPDLLAACINDGFSKEEKTEALKLQTLAYTYMDESNQADESMLQLLKTNPEFQMDPANDPQELIDLYATFRTKPLFRYGLKVGPNLSYGNAHSLNGATNLNNTEQAGAYSSGLGFQVGLTVEAPFKNKFSLNLEAIYASRTIVFENSQLVPGISEIEASEALNTLDIPLSIQYHFIESKLNPYLLVGGNVSLAVSNNLTIRRTIKDHQEVKENSFDIISMRENLQYGIHAGIGMKSRVGPGFFVLEARFNYGLNNISKQANIYDSPELIHDYYYTDSEHSVNSIAVNIGYLFNYYKPKKLRR